MKERPILFSAPMVLAILEGRKTVTRRIVRVPDGCRVYTISEGKRVADWGYADDDGDPIDLEMPCPYGAPGDRLWVRETWGYRGSTWVSDQPDVIERHISYRADGQKIGYVRAEGDENGIPQFVCKCRGGGDELDRIAEHGDELTRYWRMWRPSIFMPRWASRITLEIVDVRVERLQEITPDDALAEGIFSAGEEYFFHARDRFRELWDGINGARAAWASNPWVWRVGFKRADEKARAA